jgi:hypothetical protein
LFTHNIREQERYKLPLMVHTFNPSTLGLHVLNNNNKKSKILNHNREFPDFHKFWYLILDLKWENAESIFKLDNQRLQTMEPSDQLFEKY